MATEKRLISPDAFWDNLDLAPSEWVKASTIKAILDETPSVDAVEVVHGNWVYYSTSMQECSNCKRHTARHKFRYCPYCGAVMGDKLHYAID